eukprot:353667_1
MRTQSVSPNPKPQPQQQVSWNNSLRADSASLPRGPAPKVPVSVSSVTLTAPPPVVTQELLVSADLQHFYTLPLPSLVQLTQVATQREAALQHQGPSTVLP